MKTIVIGAGEVGFSIASHLVMEEHNVVMIDSDPVKLARISDVLDVQTIEGMGSHPDILSLAGAEDADMLIAVTKSDEVNMIACQVAYSLFEVSKKIARVRDNSYLNVAKSKLYTRDDMPVDVIISPELEVADMVVRTMSIPGAFDATYFAEDNIALLGVHLDKRSPLFNIPLERLLQNTGVELKIVGITRGGRMLIPREHDHFEPADEVFFTCRTEDIHECMSFMGYGETKTRSAFVIGGGNIGFNICKELESRGVSLRLLERDAKRAEFLAHTLSDTTILHGDALDRDILIQENIGEMDVVLAMTSDDAGNMLASVLAKQLGAKDVITRINSPSIMPLAESLHLDQIVSPREATASKILQHVRRGKVHSLHTIHEGKAEVIEAQIESTSVLAGLHIKDMPLPDLAIVGAIFSKESGVNLPAPDTVVHEGDRIIIFSIAESVHDVEALL